MQLYGLAGIRRAAAFAYACKRCIVRGPEEIAA
jgi:hypothetical protein